MRCSRIRCSSRLKEARSATARSTCSRRRGCCRSTGACREVARTLALPFGHGDLRLAERAALREDAARATTARSCCPTRFKSALIPWHAGIAVRTGYRGEMRYGLLNDVRTLDEEALPLHRRALCGARAAGGRGAARGRCREPRLAVGRSAARGAALAKHGARRLASRRGARTRRRVRARQALAARATSRRSRARSPRAARQVWLLRLGEGRADHRRRSSALSGGACVDLAGTHLARRGDRPPVARRARGHQRLGPHARRRGARPARWPRSSAPRSPEFTPPLSARARVITLRPLVQPLLRARPARSATPTASSSWRPRACSPRVVNAETSAPESDRTPSP